MIKSLFQKLTSRSSTAPAAGTSVVEKPCYASVADTLKANPAALHRRLAKKNASGIARYQENMAKTYGQRTF